MGFWEKTNWAVFVATLISSIWYAVHVATELWPNAAEPGAYWFATWAAMIGVTLLTIGAVVGTSIWMGIHEGSDLDDTWDERENGLEYAADRVSNYSQGVFLIGILVLAWQEVPHHLIGVAVVGSCLAATLMHFGTKLFLYRKGA